MFSKYFKLAFPYLINFRYLRNKLELVNKICCILVFQLLLSIFKADCQDLKYDVVVVGGSASGVTAAIQAARLGSKVLLIESSPWLGGMITAAGVSAFDGNHQLPSGIWAEFRHKIYTYYGGPQNVETGWVSNTLFEPHVGNQILMEMAKAEKKLQVLMNIKASDFEFKKGSWHFILFSNDKLIKVAATILIDATELGDIAAYLKFPASIGMDDGSKTNEAFAPQKANDIIQDLTYTMILKDFGPKKDMTISKPQGYNRNLFLCCCDTADPSEKKGPLIDCTKMMTYGKLPNNKYMINWPNCGNDIYMNLIELPIGKRNLELEKAKLHSLQFLYFLQTEMGYKNLSLADDEFSTYDNLPFIPYHRESRRVHCLSYLKVNHLIAPFDQKEKYYRIGIAVGDYPIDHHHKKNLDAPTIDFINIKIASYNVPLGSLIPKSSTNFIIAEKSIGVSNIVNGTTRLQPVVMGIGQAAGTLAAEAIEKKVKVSAVKIRDVQSKLLKTNAYIMPYIDVNPIDEHFQIIQKIGATGILKGVGIPYKWANQTWFYPDQLVSEFELLDGLRPFYKVLENKLDASHDLINVSKITDLILVIKPQVKLKNILETLNTFSKTNIDIDYKLNRRQVCVILDKFLNPFEIDVDFDGHIIQKK